MPWLEMRVALALLHSIPESLMVHSIPSVCPCICCVLRMSIAHGCFLLGVLLVFHSELVLGCFPTNHITVGHVVQRLFQLRLLFRCPFPSRTFNRSLAFALLTSVANLLQPGTLAGQIALVFLIPGIMRELTLSLCLWLHSPLRSDAAFRNLQG